LPSRITTATPFWDWISTGNVRSLGPNHLLDRAFVDFIAFAHAAKLLGAMKQTSTQHGTWAIESAVINLPTPTVILHWTSRTTNSGASDYTESDSGDHSNESDHESDVDVDEIFKEWECNEVLEELPLNPIGPLLVIDPSVRKATFKVVHHTLGLQSRQRERSSFLGLADSTI